MARGGVCNRRSSLWPESNRSFIIQRCLSGPNAACSVGMRFGEFDHRLFALARESAMPDTAELVERAEALVPELSARATEAEALRRLPDANVAALKRAGLLRILQP